MLSFEFCNAIDPETLVIPHQEHTNRRRMGQGSPVPISRDPLMGTPGFAHPTLVCCFSEITLVGAIGGSDFCYLPWVNQKSDHPTIALERAGGQPV